MIWPLLLACEGLVGTTPSYTGTVEVTEVELASSIPGRIVRIEFDEGDKVEAGALAFEIDPEALLAERKVREASIEMARAAVEGAKAQVRTARAQVAYLRRETERVTRMKDAGVGSAQQKSNLEGQLDVARSQLAAAQQAVAQATANEAAAVAALDAVDQKLDDTKVHAAVGGRVLSRNREPGEVVSPGMSVLTLGDTDRPKLRIYVPLTTVQTLSVGDEVTVRIDARPDQPLRGTIDRVATEAEFTPRDILTPEERVKRVFAVDIALEPGPGVLPGIPAEAVFE